MVKLRVALAALAIDGLCVTAHAQMFNNFAGQMLMSRQALAPVRSLALSSSRRAAQPGYGFSRRLGGGGPVGAQARTDYRRDPAVSVKVRADFVASLRQRGADRAAQAVADDFRRTDPVRVWNVSMAPDGLRDNDAADALTAYVGLNWSMANRAEMSPAQEATLRGAIHHAMQTDPAVARMSAAQRQELGENLMIVTNYLLQDYNDAVRAKDRAKLADLSALAQTRLRDEMSLNMRAMRIGANGQISTG